LSQLAGFDNFYQQRNWLRRLKKVKIEIFS